MSGVGRAVRKYCVPAAGQGPQSLPPFLSSVNTPNRGERQKSNRYGFDGTARFCAREAVLENTPWHTHWQKPRSFPCKLFGFLRGPRERRPGWGARGAGHRPGGFWEDPWKSCTSVFLSILLPPPPSPTPAHIVFLLGKGEGFPHWMG